MYSQAEMDAIIRGDDIVKHKFEPFERVLVREMVSGQWKCGIFSHIDTTIESKFICLASCYRYCIPYAGNEHLLGTTKSPEPKHEYKWGDKIEIYWTSQWRKALYGDKCKRTTGHDVYYCNACVHVEDDEIRPLKEDN